VETNHLFVKLRGKQSGQPLTYADVDSLFRRLRQKTGIHGVTPHILRHTMLTRLAELGWAPELLQVRAGHASFQQAYDIYIHPSLAALRTAWVKNPSQHIYSHLVILMGLLFYLERIEHFIKPNAPTTRIIWRDQ